MAKLATVKDIMRQIISVEAATKARDAARIMVARDIGSIVITREGKPFGIVTERDLVEKIVSRSLDPTKVTVGELMTAPLATIDAGASLVEASRRMIEKRVKRLCVADGDRIVGILSQTDIIRQLTDLEKLAKFGLA